MRPEASTATEPKACEVLQSLLTARVPTRVAIELPLPFGDGCLAITMVVSQLPAHALLPRELQLPLPLQLAAWELRGTIMAATRPLCGRAQKATRMSHSDEPKASPPGTRAAQQELAATLKITIGRRGCANVLQLSVAMRLAAGVEKLRQEITAR